MAILLAGNTLIDDAGTGYFRTVTVSGNGYIEIPDTSPAISASANAYSARKGLNLNLNNAMWSWQTSPKLLRHSGTANNWTYASYTHANGGVGLSITNHNNINTVQYTVNSTLQFSADDRNGGAVIAGNNKVLVFMSGRNLTSGGNSNNMFYIEFDEGTDPTGKTVANIEFSATPTAANSSYPMPFNANGKFLLVGRQQTAITANQWLAITGDYPIANLSTAKGLFRSGYSAPYFLLRRSPSDKDVINFALGWHPADTTSNRNIRYGKILRNGNTGPWDVWSNNSIIGNLTTGSGLPFNEDNFELVYTTNNFALLLDGVSDYLDLPANSAFALGTGNFTVECFIRTANTTADTIPRRIFMADGPTGNANGNFQITVAPTTGFANLFDNTGGLDILGNTNICDNKWHHVAATRDGTTLSLFVDGYRQNSVTFSTNVAPNSGNPRPRIGSYDGTQGDFDGYISNLRVVKGRSLYSANTFGSGFPSSILTAVANTELLTLRSNTIVDASNNNFTITANGNARMVQNTGPFMPDSVRLFDVHDDAIAFGTYRSDQSIVQYKMAYKSGNTWFVKTVCDGGNPFNGVGVRDYFGGMAISERDKYTVTVSVEAGNNEWEIREYKSSDSGNTWSVQNSISSEQYVVAARPVEESLSEDAMINNNTDTLGLMYFKGRFDGNDFTSYSTDILNLRPLGAGQSNTLIDTNRVAYLSKFNVAIGANVSLFSAQTLNGYVAGGQGSGAGAFFFSTIDKFPFSSDANAVDFDRQALGIITAAGSSSTTSGYAAGGAFSPAGPATPQQTLVYQKFSFTSGITSSIVGNLTQSRRQAAGQSSNTHGYVSGGLTGPTATSFTNTIDKYPFSVDGTDASDVGDITVSRSTSGGVSSSVSGYVTGGTAPASPAPLSSNVIDKFPFATDTNATDVGDLAQAKRNVANASDPVGGFGYVSGGFVTGPGNVIDIERFPFASDTNASDIGDLSQGRRQAAGVSSTTHGYNAGGDSGNPVVGNQAVSRTDKFPFAASSTGTNVLNLTVARFQATGHQG